MSHECHHHQTRALKVAVAIAFLFMLIEAIGGIIAGSLALLSDALHLFADVGALVLSSIVIKISHLPRTAKMSYGYHRAETLGALASALSLWALCGVLIYQAIHRLITPNQFRDRLSFLSQPSDSSQIF